MGVSSPSYFINHIIKNKKNMKNLIIVPFDLNTARKIKSGEIEGSVQERWKLHLFSRESGGDNKYECLGGVGFSQCIPYEGHEHLLGTNKNK